MASTEERVRSAIRPTALDHVALWVADRGVLAEFLYEHLGMHEIDRTEKFTLVGSDARRGKLTLFAAEGPRERGALARVGLRVADLDRAVAALPDGLELERPSPGVVCFDAPEGLKLRLVGVPDLEGPDYDLHDVTLCVTEPEAAAAAFRTLGFALDNGGLSIGDKYVRLMPQGRPEGERPLLNHLACLVDSVDDVIAAAEALGLEIADVVDAANTIAVFVWGPDRIKVEYVEHKPGFSLV
jgi:catechol 2,3-dioxygenase-like lactoylglutathione lyase family enzyme